VQNFHHKQIKGFDLEGTIHDDSSFERLKIEYVRLLKSEMRLSGYVPRLDIEPDFTIDYNLKSKNFSFKLTIYGVYVGKRKSECIEGINVTVPIYTPKNKLKESLRDQV